MTSFLLTLHRLVKAFYRSWHSQYFRSTLMLVVLTLLSGTLFYSQVEGWTALDALYFSVMTLATIGSPVLYPVTVAGKLFTMLYVIAGIGLFVALFVQIAMSLLQHKTDSKPPESKKQ